jgi:hypothetical protein
MRCYGLWRKCSPSRRRLSFFASSVVLLCNHQLGGILGSQHGQRLILQLSSTPCAEDSREATSCENDDVQRFFLRLLRLGELERPEAMGGLSLGFEGMFLQKLNHIYGCIISNCAYKHMYKHLIQPIDKRSSVSYLMLCM